MQSAVSQKNPEEFDAVLALLRTMYDEAFAIGWDIINLGDELSSELDSIRDARHVRDLQSFDLIGQRAIAQARLLQGLERLLSAHTVDYKTCIDALIRDVPFEAERRRLFAALRGQEYTDAGPDPVGGDDLDLF